MPFAPICAAVRVDIQRNRPIPTEINNAREKKILFSSRLESVLPLKPLDILGNVWCASVAISVR